LGRVTLLALLGFILLLYVSPAKHWWEQSRTGAAQAEELRGLEAENARLKRRAEELGNPDTLEQAARRLGMVKQGEKAYVIEKPGR
jgi:cell division protein FtsB